MQAPSWPATGAFIGRHITDKATKDQQTLGLQVEETAVYIKVRGWDLVRQVNDVGSVARERPGGEGLLKAAGRREIDLVVVWRLNR